MALATGFSPKAVLLLLLVASCWVREAQSRPDIRVYRHAWPSEVSRGADEVVPGAVIASVAVAKGSSETASSAAEGHEDSAAKKTLLSRQRRQGPGDPPPVPPVPPDPPIPVPPVPPVPPDPPNTSGGGGGGGGVGINPFYLFNSGFFGPPRRFGGYDPITSFFSGIESFKRDLINFFFG
ncbi:uncharacterized protein LOC124155001 [Ischnura elegans]|uniref:uncharacterized protein LOC124155001 n=1 Tax=Ischnura elegans TaxID=197161 RepID=UPI001ED89564|nr:uncharacterized protein LOC124155001 [Ischnura elegans]